LIVSNILAEIIVRFIDQAYEILKDNGTFITSGIIQNKKQEVKEALLNAGFVIEETMVMEDWVAYIARKK
jgi:ribosomal protein L11 methyltransferase